MWNKTLLLFLLLYLITWPRNLICFYLMLSFILLLPPAIYSQWWHVPSMICEALLGKTTFQQFQSFPAWRCWYSTLRIYRAFFPVRNSSCSNLFRSLIGIDIFVIRGLTLLRPVYAMATLASISQSLLPSSLIVLQRYLKFRTCWILWSFITIIATLTKPRLLLNTRRSSLSKVRMRWVHAIAQVSNVQCK